MSVQKVVLVVVVVLVVEIVAEVQRPRGCRMASGDRRQEEEQTEEETETTPVHGGLAAHQIVLEEGPPIGKWGER